MMNCPHKDKPFLPCEIGQHPEKNKGHIMYCRKCTEYYDVREIGNESSNNSFIVILGIILVIFGIAIISNQSAPSAPSANPSSQIAN